MRRVEPEILDSLPAEDPAGRRSRRDLRLVNGLMGNFRWVERRLREHWSAGPVWELGAGEGRLLDRLARAGFPATGVDLAPPPSGLAETADWRQGDLFEVLPGVSGAVVATLFLHHFEDRDLARLGALLEGCEVLCFSEPLRSSLALAEGYALFPFVNHVTRHDMIVSIRAGFCEGELPSLLGLGSSWQVREETTVLGAYRLCAWRT